MWQGFPDMAPNENLNVYFLEDQRLHHHDESSSSVSHSLTFRSCFSSRCVFFLQPRYFETINFKFFTVTGSSFFSSLSSLPLSPDFQWIVWAGKPDISWKRFSLIESKWSDTGEWIVEEVKLVSYKNWERIKYQQDFSKQSLIVITIPIQMFWVKKKFTLH